MAVAPEDDTGGRILIDTVEAGTPGGNTCIDAIAAAPADTTALVVTMVNTPETWLARYRDRGCPLPQNLEFITTGDAVGERSPTGAASEGEAVTVRTVSGPNDLTGIGIAMSDALAEATGPRLIVCMGDMTPWIQYVEMSRFYRFLHIITQRIKQSGGTAYLTVTAEASDDQTIARLRSLADEVRTIDD